MQNSRLGEVVAASEPFNPVALCLTPLTVGGIVTPCICIIAPLSYIGNVFWFPRPFKLVQVEVFVLREDVLEYNGEMWMMLRNFTPFQAAH